MFERVLRGDVERLAVGGPGDRADRAVPRVGELLRLAVFEVAQHQHEPVGLVTRARHRDVSEPFAVGRRRRQRVGRLIVLRQIDRCHPAVDEPAVDVEIGRHRLVPVGLAQSEEYRAAVGTPCKFLAAAEGLRGGVANQIAVGRPRGHRLAACEVEDEGAAVGAGGFPMVPVTHETCAILVETAGAGAGQRALVLCLAAEVGALLGDVTPGEQLGRVGRDFEARDVGVGVGHLRRGAARFRIDAPDLILARGVREEIEEAVLVEGRRGLVLARGVGDRCRLCALRLTVDEPEAGRSFVGFRLGLGHLEDNPAAVGRRRRRGNTLQRREVDFGHRTGEGGGGKGGGERDRAGKELVSHESGLAARPAGSRVIVNRTSRRSIKAVWIAAP